MDTFTSRRLQVLITVHLFFLPVVFLFHNQWYVSGSSPGIIPYLYLVPE